MSLRAKFCACAREPKPRKGAKVYMGANGMFTFNRAEAHKDFPKNVGKINAESMLKLSEECEQAVAASLAAK